jgi:predicted secreted protein
MAVSAMGTKLLIGVSSIAELTSVSGLEISADTIETTNLDSAGWRSFIQGVRDGGEVSISGYFNSADTNGQYALYTSLTAGTVLSYTITFPATLGASWTFSGIVTGYTTGAEMEDSITFEATIKVTGTPALGVTASGGLTALTLTGTGGALSPTFANGKFTYSWVFNTSTTITVTPTAASHTIKLYIDGVYIQDITSGAASNAIAFAAAESKMLALVVNESGKTQKIYEIAAVRSA